MSKVALYVPLEAKPGKENEVAEFLRSALPLVDAEIWNGDLVRDPGGAVTVCHLRYIQRRSRTRGASERQGGGGVDGQGGRPLRQAAFYPQIDILTDKLPKAA